MSLLSDLLLWFALALAADLVNYAQTRGELGWLTLLRAAIAKRIPFARVRAALVANQRWLMRLRGAIADFAWLAWVRGALVLASARASAVPSRERLPPQAPSPPPALAPALPAVAPGKLALTPVKLPFAPAKPLLPPVKPTLAPRKPTLAPVKPTLAPVNRRPHGPGECEHPIVLAHGWMAVDAFSLPGIRQEYFRGVREQLRAHGHRVYVSRVSPFASVPRRAEQLADQLAKIDADKVNIIAHSMGGLDARYAISRFGLAERVASLTTIGTPHRGTPLADASRVLRDMPLLQRALRSQLGLDLDALHDLTTAQMAEFNEAVPDMLGVRYSSYVGCVRGGIRDVHTLLAPGFAFLKRRTGHNDGIVPAASQRWGDVAGEVRADHWAQIGWSQGLDVKRFYAAIARALARVGL